MRNPSKSTITSSSYPYLLFGDRETPWTLGPGQDFKDEVLDYTKHMLDNGH